MTVLIDRAGLGSRSGFQPDRTDWKSVLRGCRIKHGDIATRMHGDGHQAP